MTSSSPTGRQVADLNYRERLEHEMPNDDPGRAGGG